MAAAFRQHKGYEELLDTGVQWVLLMTLNNSKKETRKLKEKELYAAIGWLAREGKVYVNDIEKDVEVTLI